MNGLFGLKHIILIVCSMVLVVVLFLLSRKIKHNQVCRALFYVGIVSEIIKIFYYIIINEEKYGGILPKSDLPFHLCSIQIIFIAIINIASSEKLKRFIYSFMLPSCLFGGIAAILIATDSSRNGAFIITMQYFIYHVCLIVFSLHLFTSKEIKFVVKDYFNCLKFLLAIMFFAFYINSIVYDGSDSINFMYVASPPQKGLPFLNEDQGWLVYILRYALLVVVCVSLCYIKPIINSVKQIKNKEKNIDKIDE